MEIHEELLDHPAVSDRLFYPRTASRQPNFEVPIDDAMLGCFRCEFDADWPWVLYFHGNAELAENCEDFLADMFRECQANVCFVEYRGFGASTGRPGLGAMLADGRSVFEALEIPAARTVAFGRSIGSLFAIELASRLPDLGGLVIESGIAVPHEHWPIDQIAASGRIDPSSLKTRFAEKLDHREKLGRYHGLLLVLHTLNDTLVPVSNAERLHQWGRGVDKKLKIFEWGHHNSILTVNDLDYANSLRQSIRKVLRSR